MEYGKIKPSVEQCEPNAIQGCGNPNCEVCLPKNGRGGGALGGRGDTSPNGIFSFIVDASMVRAFSAGDTYFVSRDGVASRETSDDEELRRLRETEREAREPIEKFLLKTDHQIDWSDVVGNEDAHKAMIEAIEFPVKHKGLYAFYGKRPTKGVLLKGPPGCGKTMFGKAAASILAKMHGTKAPSMISVKATELQQPFVGQTERLIRQIFAYARAFKALHGHQLVVFIDEADAILPSRDGVGGRRALPWEESNVSTFLTEMDGLEESGALVILATNRPHAIDVALLRDGRCDRQITVRRPTETAARVIFAKCLEAAPVIGDKTSLVDLAMFEFFSPLRHLMKVKTSRGTDYLNLGHTVSGAMMVGLVERAKASAFHRDIAGGTQTGITDADILAAIDTLTEEARGKPDIYALQDLAENLGVDIIELQSAKAEVKIAASGTLQ